jgi:acyl carrier protein
MVTREEVLDRVRSTMHDLFEVDPAKVTLDTRLIDDLGLDSIDAIDLAARLEEVTRKRLTEESLRKLRTVRDVVDLIFGMLDGSADLTGGQPQTPRGS